VPFCCHPTRRQFLQWAGLVAATPLIGQLERALPARANTPVAPVNLELVTLTEDTAILTWFTGDPTKAPDQFGRLTPLAADTEVWLGPSPRALRCVLHDQTPTPYHYAEITGLEPGRPYYYLALSNGVPAAPAGSSFGSPFGTSTLGAGSTPPLSFVTPAPPPGRLLFSIALCNDLHAGETVAGLAATVPGVGGVPPGISQIDGLAPYAQIMSTALAAEAPQRGADLLLVGGDVSSEAAHHDLDNVKSWLDGFGVYRSDYFVTRGNHDRPHASTEPSDTDCYPVPGSPGWYDCFATEFFPPDPITNKVQTWFEADYNGLRIIGLDTYDKPPPANGGDNGLIGAEQWAWLNDTLSAAKDEPTLVVGHHPVTAEADATTVGKPTMFDLDPQQAMQLEALYAQAPGVFLHHSGHTHRNKRTISTAAPNVMFQEVAAVKEYPGGFHLLRIFDRGYALNFYKFRDPAAQAWSERSRPEYQGLAAYYTFGNASDRNAVFARDFSGLTAAT
jgi:hypothetical protein